MTATTDERSFEDLTSDAQEALEKAGTAFTKQANQLREGAVSQLREASNKIRQQVEGQNLDANAQEQLDRVLSRLEDMSAYLEQHTVEQIEQQASDAVKQNVWRNLIIALVVGLVVGYFLSRD